MQNTIDWAAGNPEDMRIVSETDRNGNPLRTVINMRTGLIRNDPIPSDDELAKFYAENYRIAYKGGSKPRRRQILRNFRRVAGYVREFYDVLSPATKVLDVGAGSGEFAFLMTRLGKEAGGIEPNVGYAAYCREELGLNIKTAPLSPDMFPENSFDFIMLSHVLEHLNDPVKYLGMIAGWLSPEGVLYVDVPNIRTYAEQKSRGNMFHYGHIFNFNPWTLRAAAGLAGLMELPETAEHCADGTRVFFRQGGGGGVSRKSRQCRKNSAHNKTALCGRISQRQSREAVPQILRARRRNDHGFDKRNAQKYRHPNRPGIVKSSLMMQRKRDGGDSGVRRNGIFFSAGAKARFLLRIFRPPQRDKSQQHITGGAGNRRAGQHAEFDEIN